jgi:agmatinase
MTDDLLFADADADFNSAKYVITGVPFEKTSTHRKGTAQAPGRIREESYNFETYLHDLDIDLADVPVHDIGDLKDLDGFDELEFEIATALGRMVFSGKIPIVLGGEHSLSQFVLSNYNDASALVFDAHLDFRDEYEEERNSHACSVRRMSEVIGVESIIPVGVRSIFKDELADARSLGLEYVTSEFISQHAFDAIIERLERKLGSRIYISVDMDAIDPAYAPGVGTPEPFGLSPLFVRDVIRHFSSRVVCLDVVEVCPPYDNGNTSSLAAKLIRDFIGSKERL